MLKTATVHKVTDWWTSFGLVKDKCIKCRQNSKQVVLKTKAFYFEKSDLLIS